MTFNETRPKGGFTMLRFVKPFALVPFLFFASLLTSYAVAAPAPSPTTPALVAAATKEGLVTFYTSMDLQVAETLAKAFQDKYAGVTVQVERSGAERIYQRITQEYDSKIHNVDVVDSSDAANLVDYKQRGWLVAYVPGDLAKWPANQKDPDGYFAANRATLSVMGYNTKLIQPSDAPKSYADLLDPKWKSKIVKAHPSYSGNIMTATYELSKAPGLGWPYLQKLSKQDIMQVQSSTEPPKKLALGERPVMFDGNEYNALLLIDDGAPVAIVYPAEGTPLIAGASGLMKDAPHPNAARLFINYLFSTEAQQLLVTTGELRSFNPDVKEPAGRVPLSKIKVFTANPAEQGKKVDEIKQKYAEYFGT
jgi:iron(III) transport system substrate-binding protein